LHRRAQGAAGRVEPSNGNAVDLQRIVNGKHQPNEFNDQHVWAKSWLVEKAASYGLKSYKAERWHWEW
jgi:hypothetical protein